MMVNIAVCDDKQESLDIIQKELVKAANNLNITIETYLYMDGNEVVDLICNNKEEFDILFLDIDMPNISGLVVAKKIRDAGSDIILIFISAHEQYVFESIKLISDIIKHGISLFGLFCSLVLSSTKHGSRLSIA